MNGQRRLLRDGEHANYLMPIKSVKKFSRESYESGVGAKKHAFSPARFRTIALDSKPDYSHHIKMTVGKKRSSPEQYFIGDYS
jgi:hypothetical protein